MDKSSKIALVMWTLVPIILIAGLWFLLTHELSKLKPAPVSDIENTEVPYVPPAFNGTGDKG